MFVPPTLMTFITLEELKKCFVRTSDLRRQMGNTAEVWWSPACSEHTLKQPLGFRHPEFRCRHINHRGAIPIHTQKKEESLFKWPLFPQCSRKESGESPSKATTMRRTEPAITAAQDNKITITSGRSETTEEFQLSLPVYPGAQNPSSQLQCLACLTTHTEPVLLGLHGETSHTGQTQMPKNSSRVGIIFLIILELKCCSSLSDTEKKAVFLGTQYA